MQATLESIAGLLQLPDVHKATGWTLREVGKKGQSAREGFLDRHAGVMPRTMLRYAIERFPPDQQRAYLQKTTPGKGDADGR